MYFNTTNEMIKIWRRGMAMIVCGACSLQLWACVHSNKMASWNELLATKCAKKSHYVYNRRSCDKTARCSTAICFIKYHLVYVQTRQKGQGSPELAPEMEAERREIFKRLMFCRHLVQINMHDSFIYIYRPDWIDNLLTIEITIMKVRNLPSLH